MSLTINSFASPAAVAATEAVLGAPIASTSQPLQQQMVVAAALGSGSGTQNVQVVNGASFSIPTFDYQGFTYFGATNNIQTQVFKSGGSGGTTVATLTYAYSAGGAADDDLITSITQS